MITSDCASCTRARARTSTLRRYVHYVTRETLKCLRGVVQEALHYSCYDEKETRRLQNERKVWAATNDNAVQVAARAHGANVVSANWLVRELKGSRQATGTIINEFNEQQFRKAGGAHGMYGM